MRRAVDEHLLERDAERAGIAAGLRAAAAGAGSVTLIEGPAGIGKSRLLEDVAAGARAHGMTLLSAGGRDLERHTPFGGAADLFGGQVAGAAPVARAALLAGHAGLAATLFDPLAADPGDADALVRGLYWLTVNLIAEAGRPLAIAIDDAHWVDLPTLRFLTYLAARAQELPLALVVTIRSGEPASAPELVAWLRDQPGHRRLQPRLLSAAAVGQMVATELPDPDPAFVDACAQVSGGNPFLARELVRSLRADGVAPTPAAVPGVRGLVPGTVLQSVLIRLARLGDDCRRLAAAVAVLGDGAALRHAGSLASLEAVAAENAADALARAQILLPGEPLRFTHALIATAVASDAPAFARARAHRRAAELLDADGAGAERVAAHLRLTRPDGDPWTVAQLRGAARRAIARADSGGAAGLLGRALAEPPPADERAAVLLELAGAEMGIGAAASLGHVDDALALLTTPADRAGGLAVKARVLLQRGEHAASNRVVQEALELVSPDDPGLQALLADELNATFLQIPARGRSAARLATLARSAAASAPPAHPALAAHLALQLAFDGAPAGRVRALAEHAVAADALAGGASHALPVGILVQALVCVDALDLAEQVADAAIDAARARGLVIAFTTASFHRAIPRLHRGALADALADVEQTLSPQNEGWSSASPWVAALLARIQLERGDLAAARGALALAEPEATPSMGAPVLRHAQAQVALAERDPGTALAAAVDAGEQLDRVFGVDRPGFIAWRVTAALAAAAQGDTAEARAFAIAALERARADATPRPLAQALRCAAHVGDPAQRVPRLREAVAVLAGSPALLARAHALADLGAALRRNGGGREAAQPPLREALQLADGMGAAALATRAREELRATGARPRRAAYVGVDALTPSERRVCQLAADGLTNPQIAQALFVTQKTIQTHLAHSYRKLGIGSRRALPAALAGPATTHPGS